MFTFQVSEEAAAAPPASKPAGRVVKVALADIIIGDRHRKDFGDLKALADSIEQQGLLQPIGITEKNELVFGERRLQACRDHLNWTSIDARIVNVTSIVEAERDENDIRKDFTPSERVAIAEAVREQLGNRQGQRTDKLPDNSPEVESGEPVQIFAQVQPGAKTRQIAAKKAGFGNAETYRQAKAVTEMGVPELVQKMDAGEISISAAAVVADEDAETQREIANHPEIKKAVKALKEAKALKAEADAMPVRQPPTPEEAAEHRRIFGTQEDRAALMDVLAVTKLVTRLPAPADMVAVVPPALDHSVDPVALLSAADWFEKFARAWEAKGVSA